MNKLAQKKAMKMRQKFPPLTFVHITENMPSCMSHFEHGIDAIVEGTYASEYGGGGNNFKQYSLFLLRDGWIYNASAWYEEDQLTHLKHQDTDAAQRLIDEYREYGPRRRMRNVNTEVVRHKNPELLP